MPIKQVINNFIKGVNADLAEDAIQEGMLTNGHNIKLTNNDNKLGVVQKQEGYKRKVKGYPRKSEIDFGPDIVEVTDFYPVAAQEYNDVLYIVSILKYIDRTGGGPGVQHTTIEFGTYPSAGQNPQLGENNLVYEYAPLPNNCDGSSDCLNPFRFDIEDTIFEEYAKNSEVDIEIQPSYDGSVNIITTVEGTVPAIVNSRQAFHEDTIEIIERLGDNKENVYSQNTLSKLKLVPSLESIIPDLQFKGVFANSGKLINGGYKYYFKLVTADGTESPIIEESRLVSIHTGDKYGEAGTYIDDTLTSNSVVFELHDINTVVYTAVVVYYTRSTGQTKDVSTAAFKIDTKYDLVADGAGKKAIIHHTGYETQIPVDISEITAEYTPITSVKTLSQKNNRLILGNVKTDEVRNSLLQEAALKCYVEHDYTSAGYVIGTGAGQISYADPRYIYDKVSYFPEETYEFAINFIFKNGSVSEAYPIMGFDYTQSATTFDYTKLGQDIGWYSKEYNQGITYARKVQNSKGVVRLKDVDIDDIYNHFEINILAPVINTQHMTSMQQQLKQIDVIGYYISRRHRIKDKQIEGLLTLAATANISAMFPAETSTFSVGTAAGYGLSDSVYPNLVLFPIPTNAVPFSTENQDAGGNADNAPQPTDCILYATLPDASQNKYYALYSPDLVSDTAYASQIFDGKETSMMIVDRISGVLYDETQYKVLRYHYGPFTRYPYEAVGLYIEKYTHSKYLKLKTQFVDDAMQAFNAMAFTGRLDRQIALALYRPISSGAEHPRGWDGNCSDIDDCSPPLNRHTQFDSAAGVLDSNSDSVTKYSVEYAKLKAVNFGCSASFPWDGDHPGPQIPMTNVAYSPYLGIETEHPTVTLTNGLNRPGGETNTYFSAYATFTGSTCGNNVNLRADIPQDNIYLGYYTKIYHGNNGGPLSQDDWINRYSGHRSDNYFAISKRYEIDFPLSLIGNPDEARLRGGDCYVGIFTQRVWRPGGIGGIPTATNPSNYVKNDDTITREGTGITNSGYAINFPVRSNYNFAIRAYYKADELDKNLYKRNRTYPRLDAKGDVMGNRQPETNVINYGNIIEDSIIRRSLFTDDLPYFKHAYTNRILVSEESATNQFENGYRNFRGLNFKDYDEDLGPLVTMASNGLYTYLIFSNGVSMIELSERHQISGKEGSANVYVGIADVLPPKTAPIFSTIGSQHLKAVVSTESMVFGVDANTKKIWKITGNKGELISDNRIQTLLNDIITDELTDVIASYDAVFKEVTFVFKRLGTPTTISIVYNVQFDMWYGTSDINKEYQAVIQDVQVSLQKPSSEYQLYYPINNKYHSITDPRYPRFGVNTIIDDIDNFIVFDSYFEFVIKDTTPYKFDLQNIEMHGVGVPSKMDIFTEVLGKYTVNPASISILNKKSNILPVYTNIYMLDVQGLDIWPDSSDRYRIYRSKTNAIKSLAPGDPITIDLISNSNPIQMQVIVSDILTEIPNTDTIILSEPLPFFTTDITSLYYGWRVPARISLGEYYGGVLKLTMPSKLQADLMAGNTIDRSKAHANMNRSIPYGRWVKLGMHFNGTDQIYINSIISTINPKFS